MATVYRAQDLQHDRSVALKVLHLSWRRPLAPSGFSSTRFAALPDTVCPCVPDRLLTARLLAARGQEQQAKAVLDRIWFANWDPNAGILVLERARVADRLGQREAAGELYRFVADLWRTADPELQPYVAEARDRLEHLSAEHP